MNPAVFNSIVNEPQKFRDHLRRQITTLYSLSEKDAANIEISIYNGTLQEATYLKIVKKWENKNFTQIYLDHLRSIFINLKNPEFLNRIVSGEIAPQQVGFLSHQEICPTRWSTLLEMKAKRDESRGQRPVTASTGLFKCRRCRSEKCTYYELQTKSGDESTDIFVQCSICLFNWKQ